MILRNLAKYFIHGLAFSILFLILALAWAFVFFILIDLGFIIGFIIGMVLLFLMVGFLNSLITGKLWFKVKQGFWDLLFHGVVLFILLLLSNVAFLILFTIFIVVSGIIRIAPTLAYPGIGFSVIILIVTTLLDGVIGKRVAGLWIVKFRDDSHGLPKAIEAEKKDQNL